MFENLKFGKTGFKTCVLEKHFISYSCILFLIFNALRSFFKNQVIFFKNSVFSKFWLIQSVFRLIEITFKILCELLSVSINRNWFSINRISWISFLKIRSWLIQLTFFKSFQTFLSLSLSNSARLHSKFFCCFPPNFLQGFSLLKPVCLYYPSFCIDFHIFMHYLMVFQ